LKAAADRQRRKHRAQAHHPADGQVDARGDDDESLAEAKEQDRDDGDENVLRVRDGDEVDRTARRQRHGDDENQDHEGEKHPRPDAAEEDRRALGWGEDTRGGNIAPRGPDGSFRHDFCSLNFCRASGIYGVHTSESILA